MTGVQTCALPIYAFKSLFPEKALSQFDDLITDLDKFEEIRYPNKNLTNSAEIVVSMGQKVTQPIEIGGNEAPVSRYDLGMAEVDKLFQQLFTLCGFDPKKTLVFLKPEGRQMLTEGNGTIQTW